MNTCKDFILEMCTMDRAEQFVIAEIVKALPVNTSTGEVVIKTTDMSSADSNKFIKGSKSLILRKLVKRTKRSHYMLHPNAIPPRDHELALEIWEKL